MATFTIIAKGSRRSGSLLLGYRFIVTHSGGDATYQLLPPKALGSSPLGSDTAPSGGPMSLPSVLINKQIWSIDSDGPAPNPAPKGTKWSGRCFNFNSSVADPGTWTAEASGGVGVGGKGGKGTSKKSAKSTKSTSKTASKGTSKKSAKSTKSIKGSKGSKGSKGTSKKGVKSAKSTKSAKSAKKTRGRG